MADSAARRWYITATNEHGWSRALLVRHSERDLCHRQGHALNNFAQTLPPSQAALAQHMLQGLYTFDFLNLGEEAHKRDLERTLLAYVRNVLLELGVGFALVGNQYHLEIGDQDCYLDLLFAHLRLRCYVVIDLKIGEFKPEDAGKMNFYLTAADERLRYADDQPSSGFILCKSKNRISAEYALRGIHQPIGVSDYALTRHLPKDWRGACQRLRSWRQPSPIRPILT